MVFVSLLETGTLARLNQGQCWSREASVPECNSGGLSVLRALGVATVLPRQMLPRQMLPRQVLATQVSPGPMSLRSVGFNSVAGGGHRADPRKRTAGVD